MKELRLRLLQEMPIFGGITLVALHCMLDNCQVKSVSAGDFFFYEGDDANAMYVLEAGRVAVYRKWQSLDYKLREMSKGDCFGEMALMDFSHRSAAVKAIEDCSALEITTTQLQEVYARYPEQFTIIQMNMGREVCRRLRDADHRLFLNDLEKYNICQSQQAYHMF